MKKVFSCFVFFMYLTTFSFSADTVNIQILGTSQLNEKFMPYNYDTGIANSKGSMVQLATLIRNLKSGNENTFLFDSGNATYSNWYELFLNDGTTPAIEYFNYAKYDAVTPGNKDFDLGVEAFNKVFKPFNEEIILANLYKNDERVYKPYKIFKKNGVKIALIGVMTPYMKKLGEDYTVTNPADEVAKIITVLKGKADIIIVSANVKLSNEYGNQGSAKEIAKKNPEVSIIFAGYEPTLINERAESGAVLINSGKFGEYLSKINIVATKKNDNWIISDKSKDISSENIAVKDITPDLELTNRFEKFNNLVLNDTHKIIGDLIGGDLVRANDISEIPIVQLEPTPLVQLINEVQRYYTKADISSTPIFKSDANILEGPIKKSDIAAIYNSDNTLRAYKFNGAQLKKYMEWSASFYNTLNPEDLTVSFNENIKGSDYDIFSGIYYEINLSNPPGMRIENLRKSDGSPVKDTDTFTVAISDYRADSTLFSEKNGLFKPEEVPLVIDLYKTRGNKSKIQELIKEYISTVKGGVITPEMTENWELTGISWDPELHSKVLDLIAEKKLSIPKSENGKYINIKSITTDDLESFETPQQ